MKQCPVCKTTYTDNTLQFCLADGTTLSFSSSEQQTEQFSAATNPIRVNISRDETPTIMAKSIPPSPEPEKKNGKSWNLVFGLMIGFVGSAILALIFIGAIWWQKVQIHQTENTANSTPANTNSLIQSPTPDESAILKEKIANLEKKVQEQKNKQPQVPTITNVSTPQTNKVTAKAHSPGDGFLALRTAPSAETGERILQIPHGATLTVLSCLPKAAGKKGRWCRVDYNGNSGWAFDGYMIYQ